MADLKIDMHSGRDVVKRYVVGLDENGKSAVLTDGVPNQQELTDWFWRATLWKTKETPVDNGIPGDRSLDGDLAARSPFPCGMLVRVEWVLPEHGDVETNQKLWDEINTVTGHTQVISEKDKQRSPSMHRTNTLDVMTILRGEIYLLLDDDEILLKPTDTVIVQGVNHGWSNRGTEPCLFTAVMIDAIPRQ
jgi:mannose-6-phosphate isomerase-like protein (cupin superfamily)